MRDAINVDKDDILWQFYCKRFTIEGKEIEHPKNLCRYFWTSVHGFALWIGREVKLRYFWLTTILSSLVFFGLANATKQVNAGSTLFVLNLLALGFGIFMVLAFFTTMVVNLYRIDRRIGTRARVVAFLFSLCLIIATVAYSIVQGTFWPETLRIFARLLPLIGYGLVASVALFAIVLILSAMPRHSQQKLWRVFQTFGVYAAAKKSRACPRVTPPKDFKIP